MPLIEPPGKRPVASVSIPRELYWVLDSPAPLLGMKYPRKDFPWAALADVGVFQLVALEPGDYDPSPVVLLSAEKLEDLAHGGPSRTPDRERATIKRIVTATVKALQSGSGVAVHCIGGRGRSGTVIGCTLRKLGYGVSAVLEYLERLHQACGKPDWPESRWQAQLVESWADHRQEDA